MTSDPAPAGWEAGPADNSWCVAISSGTKLFGSGVLISPTQVLTCLHVVVDAQGDNAANVRRDDESASPASEAGDCYVVVNHVFPDRKIGVREVRAARPDDADLALLTLCAPVTDANPAPLVRCREKHLTNHHWWAFGHPQNDPYGDYADGRIGGELAKGTLKLKVSDSPIHSAGLDKGFSGAGLWSYEAQGVVGIVIQRHGPATGRAVSMEQASQTLPELAPLMRDCCSQPGPAAASGETQQRNPDAKLSGAPASTETAPLPRPSLGHQQTWYVAIMVSADETAAVAGGGVLVTPTQVLTHGHVLDVATDADGDSEWFVRFSAMPGMPLRRVKAHVRPKDNPEIGLLELDDPVPGAQPAPCLSPTPRELVGHEWWAFGYPDGNLPGKTARGSIGQMLALEHVRLDADGRTTGLGAGFTGAGVWSLEARGVIAIIAPNLGTQADRALPLKPALAFLPPSKKPELARPGPLPAPPPPVTSELDVAPLTGELPRSGKILGAPPKPIPTWVDRPELLQEIRAAFEAPLDAPRVVTLTGPAGVGKSRLAEQYARELVEAGFVVAWLQAHTDEGLRASLASVAEGWERGPAVPSDDQPSAYRWMVSALDRDNHDALLVFDNASRIGDIEPYLPFSPRVRVLITADAQEDFAKVGPIIDVARLDREASIRFLQSRFGLDAETCAAIAAAAGGLPLALIAAAELVKRHPATAPSNGERSINATILAAQQCVPHAETILTAMAALHQDGVSPAVLDTVTGFKSIDAARELVRLKLLNNNVRKQWLLPRLIGRAVREVHAEDWGECMARTASRLAPLVDREDAPSRSATNREVVRHAHRLLHLLQRNPPAPEHRGEVINLANAATNLLRRGGDIEEQSDLARPAYEAAIQLLPNENRYALRARSNYAAALRLKGRPKEALVHEIAVLKERERQLPPEDPAVLASRSSIAACHLALGDAKRAAEMDEETLELRRRHLPMKENDPATLRSAHNLASAYILLGRLDDAVAMDLETLKRRRRVLPTNHPATLESFAQLTRSYLLLENFPSAVTYGTKAMEGRASSLGKEHRYTLASSRALVAALRGASQLDQAIQLAVDTERLCSRLLGPEHADTIAARVELSLSFRENGRFHEAMKLDQETLQLCNQAFGVSHEETLACRDRIAAAYRARKQYEKAFMWDLDTLVVREMQGGESSHILTSAANLARDFFSAGRYREALSWDEWVRREREDLTESKPQDQAELRVIQRGILDAQQRVAADLRALGAFAAANEWDEKSLATATELLGERHPETLRIQHALALGYRHVHAYQKALTLAKHTFEFRERVCGENHRETLESLVEYAGCLRALGKPEVALSTLERAIGQLRAAPWQAELLLARVGEEVEDLRRCLSAEGSLVEDVIVPPPREWVGGRRPRK